jgi:hypothetical protein
MTPEQKKIMAFAQSKGGTFTKAEIVEAMGKKYYCNGDKHLGDRLSRMVNANILKRVKLGLFEISTGKKSKPSTIAEGQTELF